MRTVLTSEAFNIKKDGVTKSAWLHLLSNGIGGFFIFLESSETVEEKKFMRKVYHDIKCYTVLERKIDGFDVAEKIFDRYFDKYSGTVYQINDNFTSWDECVEECVY